MMLDSEKLKIVLSLNIQIVNSARMKLFTVQDFENFLCRNGWCIVQVRETSAVWKHNEKSTILVILPGDNDYDDNPQRFQDAIHHIAIEQECSPLAVYLELLEIHGKGEKA